MVAAEGGVGLKPPALDFVAAGTIPEVGLTSLLSLKRTGSKPGTPLPKGTPWPGRANLTVVVTAGSGGTGSVGIMLAKAWCEETLRGVHPPSLWFLKLNHGRFS